MKYLFFPFLFLLLVVSATSCKKVCYDCTQYCAYCALKSDTSIIYKVCTSKYADRLRVDSIESSFPDSLYICNILNKQVEVCDGKNAIDQAITYYEQEDYFCTAH